MPFFLFERHHRFRLARGIEFYHMRRFIKTTWGIVLLSLIGSWTFGVADRWKFTLRHFVNQKMLKYIPTINGGQVLFPFTLLLQLGFKSHPHTQWSSFDQRSFYPHSDGFKVQVAILHNDMNLLKTLLQRVSPNIIVQQERKTPALGLAAALSRIQALEYLLDKGASLEEVDIQGNNPLMLAIINNQTDPIQFLVDAGTSLEQQDNYGYTALEKARNRGFQDIVMYLENQETQKKKVRSRLVVQKLEFDSKTFRVPKNVSREYQPKKMMQSSIYPFYKNTSGFLVYFFKQFELPNLEFYCQDFAFHNRLDDKCSSEQELFSFGEVLQG